jgi:hypothetical protein
VLIQHDNQKTDYQTKVIFFTGYFDNGYFDIGLLSTRSYITEYYLSDQMTCHGKNVLRL